MQIYACEKQLRQMKIFALQCRLDLHFISTLKFQEVFRYFKTLIIKFHCLISSLFLVIVQFKKKIFGWFLILTLKTKYCTRTPSASTPLLACISSAICFCFSSVCWSTSCWSNCCCILLTFELFLLTILLLLLFSSSLTLVFGDTLSESRMMVPLRVAVAFGGGVAGFDE